MGNNSKNNNNNNNLCNCSSGQRLNYCRCCEGIKTFTPANIENPPSLPSIRYRIGTHGMFKTSMLATISREKYKRRLSRLTTREDNDFAIAIIDAWATIADVITFYQERVANEGFLRTSTERMSVLELARSIGYELGPGVASDTFLAFTLEDNNPSIEKSIIEACTKVQSIPHQGEAPQTFETIEKIEARPELNEIKANTKLLHIVDRDTNTLYFRGVDTKLRRDDGLLIVDKNDQQNRFFAKVLDIRTDEKKDLTIANIQIIWPPTTQDGGLSKNTDASIKLTGFGSNSLHTQSVHAVDEVKGGKLISTSKFLGKELKLSQYTSISIQKDVNQKELIDDQSRVVEKTFKSFSPRVYAFRQKAAIFGHNAPSYEAITFGTTSELSNWDSPLLFIYQKVHINKTKPIPPSELSASSDHFESYEPDINKPPIIFFDNVYENIITKNQDKNDDDSGNWVVFSSTES